MDRFSFDVCPRLTLANLGRFFFRGLQKSTLRRYESSSDFRQRLRTPFPPRILAKFIPGGAGIGIPFYLSPLNIIYLHQAASRSRCKNWDFSRSRFVMGASHFTKLEFEHALTKRKLRTHLLLSDNTHEALQNAT